MNETTAMEVTVLPARPHLIEGPRLNLRDLCAEDANDTYARWMNDPEVTRYTENRERCHTYESLLNYIQIMSDSPYNLFLAIVAKESKRHIGNIKLGSINPIHLTADIGIIIGEKDYWGQGLASEAINLLAEYAFDVIGLYKLTAGAYTINKGSIRAFKKSGFKIEGVLKKQCVSNDGRIDVTLMGRLCKTANNTYKVLS